MFFLLGGIAALGAVWKVLGRLLHPVAKKWLSQDVTFGFVHLLSLRKAYLEQAALDAITEALRTNLPVRAAEVYVGRLTLSVGLLAGLSLRANGVRIVLEWVSEDDWDDAVESIEQDVQGRSAQEAKAGIELVQNKQKPRSPVPSFLAGFIESFISSGWICIRDLDLSLRDGGSTKISVAASLLAKTSRCWAIEWRGTQAKASLELAVSAGGEELISPATAQLTVKMPRVLQTLLMPVSSPKKKVQVEASLKKLAMTAQPIALCALMQASGRISRFGEWKASVERTCSEFSPMDAGDREAYMEALTKGEDVAKWERNMTTAEILRVYSDWKQWEVPPPWTLEEWLERLQDEQKPVRSIEASVTVNSIALEALGEDALPGDGFALKSSMLQLEAHVLDAEAPAAGTGEADTETFASTAAEERGPMKLRANVGLSSLTLMCDANDVFAMPVLEPCELLVRFSSHKLGDKSTVHVSAQFQKAASAVGGRSPASAVGGQEQRSEPDVIVATISSRSVWKLQSVLVELAQAMNEAEEDDMPIEHHLRSVAHKRQQEHQAELEKAFHRMDADSSGFLEKQEVHALVASMYGDHMTKRELATAGDQLFAALDTDGSGSVGLDELLAFFGQTARDAASGMVCLRLYEYRLPLKADFEALEAFRDMAGADGEEELKQGKPGVLQLQWVRTLQNYQEAKRTWAAAIAPTLAPRFQEWKLNSNMQAVDFWNDPTFSLTGHRSRGAKKDFGAVLSMQIAGVSLRLADSQHACSIPRVRIDMEKVGLEGGIHMLSNRVIPWCEGLSAEVNLHATYWNERAMSAEPFIEPWNIALRAQGDDVSVRAEEHIVVNVTPPFLQAVTVAAAALQNLEGVVDTKVDDRFVVVWVVNCTNCDIKVSARGPAGQGKPVAISRADYSKRVPVEIQGAKPSASLRLRNSDDSWTLTIEGQDSSGSWCLQEGIDFSITGRQLFRVGETGDRLLAASTQVDVHKLAPILTLSGTTTLRNRTQKVLTLSDGDRYNVTVGPGQACKAAIGGGLKLSLPVASGGQEETLTVDMPEDGADDAHGDVMAWRINRGYRFILHQREDQLRNAAQGELAKVWTLECTPMLTILNALPCSLGCIMRNALAEGELNDDMGLPVPVEPGATFACDDIDPNHPVTVDVELCGIRYQAVIRQDVLKTKRGVLRMQAATRRGKGRNAVALSCESAEAYCSRTGKEVESVPEAPLLDVEFSWEHESAVLVVYAHYWLANKTGWELEASSSNVKVGRTVGMKGEMAKPAPLQDTTPGVGGRRKSRPDGAWDDGELRRQSIAASSTSDASLLLRSAGGDPEIALMRLEGKQLHVKLHWFPSGQQWSWDTKREECPLQHWVWSEAEKASETGWSSALAVELAGTSGVAELPLSDEISQSVGVASVLGVSVTDLPAPFQRTKMITMVPRYVVRNDLEEAVQLWPGVGSSRRAPTGEAPAGLPVVQPGGCLAIDAMPFNEGVLASSLAKELPMVSVRSCKDGATQDSCKWSVQVHLSMVGDTTLTIGTGAHGDPIRVVRASVQRSEATIFVILVKGQWPFGIENHSLVHTVAFYQKRAEGLEEWVLNPCQKRNFVLPDPDKPKHLMGRICGAGQKLCVQYELNDLSQTDQLAPLKVFGSQARDVALEVSIRIKGGHTQLLVLSDPKPLEVDETQRLASNLSIKPTGSPRDGGGIMKLALDIFVMGIHASLIDTSGPTPVELLALTVDYIQLQKQRKQRAVTFTIHNVQLDDFGMDDCFIFGPGMSGLNSQRSAMADSRTFTSLPLLQVTIAGPRNPANPIYDEERGLLSLQAMHLNFQPIEANVDVPRLVALWVGLKEWLDVIDWDVTGSTSGAAGRSLRRVLAPGFTAPQRGGDLVCYIALWKAEAIQLVVDVKLKKRAGDAGKDDMEDEALQIQLSQLSQRVWKPFRFIIDFLARMGTGFAEASPRFNFREMKLPHLNGNMNVVKASVAGHYQSQLVGQVAKTFGSLQVLGDPVNLLDDISSSFNTFLKKTREEIKGEREGLGEGVGDLAGGVVGGALGSVTKVSGSLKDLVGSVTGRPIGSDKRATCVSDGIDLGLMSLAAGISEAVTGLVEDPLDQAQTAGFSGFCKGSLMGTAGLFTRPIEGFLGAVEKFAQGAENQVRGVHRGYLGLRRPPRVNFWPGARGLQALDQAFFWPQWTMKVLSVSLPVLWKERKVKELVIFPQQALTSTDNEVYVVRGEELDMWALQGQSPENDFAIGRTGCLRGPFQLQVDAMVDGNLEMTKLFRVTVGCGELPLEDLVHSLRTYNAPPLKFKVQAQRSPVLGEAFVAKQDEVMGEVVVELMPAINDKILPKRFTTTAEDGLETLGPAAEVGAPDTSTEGAVSRIAQASLSAIQRLPIPSIPEV